MHSPASNSQGSFQSHCAHSSLMTPITLPEADVSSLRGSSSSLPLDPRGTEPHHRSPQVLSHLRVTCGEHHTLFTHLDWGGLGRGLAETHTWVSSQLVQGSPMAASLGLGNIVAKKAGAGPQVLRPGFATYSLML